MNTNGWKENSMHQTILLQIRFIPRTCFQCKHLWQYCMFLWFVSIQQKALIFAYKSYLIEIFSLFTIVSMYTCKHQMSYNHFQQLTFSNMCPNSITVWTTLMKPNNSKVNIKAPILDIAHKASIAIKFTEYKLV